MQSMPSEPSMVAPPRSAHRTGHRPSPRIVAIVVTALVTVGLLCGAPAGAWTPVSQILLAERGVRVAPADFRRQLEEHEAKFREGVLAPFRTAEAIFHESNRDSGRLQDALRQEVERTIAMITAHRPFEEIAYQAGVVAHYVNDLNNPLNCAADDPSEGQYYADYLRYLESTEPRLEYLFYGLSPVLEGGDVDAFVRERLERCRAVYPLVGQEYRRIGKLPGTRWFDDRSTAFGVSGVSHSRAITDVALVLRHIWLRAGGEDWRQAPAEHEGRFYLVDPPTP